MVSTKTKFIVTAILFLLASSNLFAQNSARQIERELDETLLKKDLLEVIKYAEKSPKNDVASLYRRLILYRRAVDFEKATQITKQLLYAKEQSKNNFHGGSVIKNVLGDTLFRDTEAIKFYLQRYSFYLDEDLFKKFTELCLENKSDCDVYSFDNWLGQKVLENEKSEYEYERWLGNRLKWRESFGLDKQELLNKFEVDFHNDPNNLILASRYLKRFPKSQTVDQIAEKFNSKQAYDYYSLGNRMINISQNSSGNAESKKAINKHGIAFLNKSLEIPFNQQDIVLMYKGRMSAASYQPRKIDHKKQFQYWVKSKLAKTYIAIGEADKAQPIAEELAKMDKSDIRTRNIEYLAGAVQMASGARVIEKKILSEQTKRENTAEYWIERADYYHGRKELQLVYDAYLEGLNKIPLDLKNEQTRQNRSSLISSYASFASDFSEYAEDLKDVDGYDLNDEQKLKAKIWLEAESFLRGEFNRTKNNLPYSYSLLDTIRTEEFDELFAELFDRNPDSFLRIFRHAYVYSYSYSRLIDDIWESEGISQAKKDDLFSQLFNIAQASDPEKTLHLVEIIKKYPDKFSVQLIPVLNRNLDKIEQELKLRNNSSIKRGELEYLKGEYLELIFSNYLLAKDWRSAEKLMTEKFDWSVESSYDRYTYIKQIAVTAAENRDYANAGRLWKMRANLSQRNLNGLEILSQYDEVKAELVDFYKQMKLRQPYSPIPEMALKILR